MKILIIAHAVSFPIAPPASGSKIIVYNLIKELSRKHEVHVVSFCHSDVEKRGVKELERYCTSLEIVNVSINRTVSNVVKKKFKQLISLITNKPLVGIMFNTEKMRKKIRRVQEHTRFDMVYVSNLAMAQYVCDIRESTFKMVAPYDSLSLRWDRMMKVKSNKKLFNIYADIMKKDIRKYEKLYYSLYDSCHVVSEDDMIAIKEICPDLPIYVIPNGVDMNYFKPLKEKNEDNNPSLIFTGMFASSPNPNSDAVIFFIKKVLPIIYKEIPSLTFFVVGGNPPEEILRLASKQIIVTGFVEDVRPYIAEATVYVSPLRIGTGIKNKVLEAMSMGKAIVATSVGCLGISVKNGEDIIISNNPEEMADTIVDLLKDESKRKSLGYNARQAVKKYSWQEVAKRIEGIEEENKRVE